MKKIVPLLGVLLALAGFWGCQTGSSTGTVSFSIADAPVDDPNIDGVWLTITEVRFISQSSQSTSDLGGPRLINLLDYQNGLAFLLGSVEAASGQVDQVRFVLDAPPETDKVPPTTPGCYVRTRRRP